MKAFTGEEPTNRRKAGLPRLNGGRLRGHIEVNNRHNTGKAVYPDWRVFGLEKETTTHILCDSEECRTPKK